LRNSASPSENKKSAWEQYKENLGETRPWDIVLPKTDRASEEDAESRYSICKSCPEFIKLTKQCKKCGCLMSAKTKLALATCPIGKW
jgi:hypothetical protein